MPLDAIGFIHPVGFVGDLIAYADLPLDLADPVK